jgi:hypothetical protein
MADITTTIDGYLCELTLPDEHGATFCTVSKGRLRASLGCLLDEGCLHDDEFNNGPPVPARTLARIEEWADAHDY